MLGGGGGGEGSKARPMSFLVAHAFLNFVWPVRYARGFEHFTSRIGNYSFRFQKNLISLEH
jgi:hypothetical protein